MSNIENTGFGARDKKGFRINFYDRRDYSNIIIAQHTKDTLIKVLMDKHKPKSLQNILKLFRRAQDSNEYIRKGLRIEITGYAENMYKFVFNSEEKTLIINGIVIQEESQRELLEKYLKIWLEKQSPEILKN